MAASLIFLRVRHLAAALLFCSRRRSFRVSSSILHCRQQDHTIQHDIDTPPYYTAGTKTTQYNTPRYRHSSVLHCRHQDHTIQCNTVRWKHFSILHCRHQDHTIQCNTVRWKHSSMLHCRHQDHTIQCNTVRCKQSSILHYRHQDHTIQCTLQTLLHTTLQATRPYNTMQYNIIRHDTNTPRHYIAGNKTTKYNDTARYKHSSILHCRQQDYTIQCNRV